jgi:transposase-like protein
MYCPQCPKGLADALANPLGSRRKSFQNQKNGFRRGKQGYRCKDCGCQYVENPQTRAYSNEVKQLC